MFEPAAGARGLCEAYAAARSFARPTRGLPPPSILQYLIKLLEYLVHNYFEHLLEHFIMLTALDEAWDPYATMWRTVNFMDRFKSWTDFAPADWLSYRRGWASLALLCASIKSINYTLFAILVTYLYSVHKLHYGVRCGVHYGVYVPCLYGYFWARVWTRYFALLLRHYAMTLLAFIISALARIVVLSFALIFFVVDVVTNPDASAALTAAAALRPRMRSTTHHH